MIQSRAIFICLLLTLIFEARSYAGSPISQQQNFDSATKINSMKNEDTVTLRGILNKKITVGYRSPYILVTHDAKEFEIRESDLVERSQLEKYIGQKIELTGKQVTIPSQKAPSGSESGARFIDGIIPELEYIETISIRKPGTY